MNSGKRVQIYIACDVGTTYKYAKIRLAVLLLTIHFP